MQSSAKRDCPGNAGLVSERGLGSGKSRKPPLTLAKTDDRLRCETHMQGPTIASTISQ